MGVDAIPEHQVIFTEDEVAGKIAKWANGPDSPVDFYNIKIELNSTGIGEGSGKFDYSIFTGKKFGAESNW